MAEVAATLRRLARHNSFRLGFVLVLALTLAALLAPWVTAELPTVMHLRMKFRPPSAASPFGTDQFGRDILTRVLYGGRLSLWIGFATAVLSSVLGAAIGVVSAQYRRLDAVLMRIMDGLMAFPAILLAIGVSAALGPQTGSVIAALSFSYMPRTARVVRASALVIRELEFVDAARVAGAHDLRLMFRHILPNCMGPLLVQFSFTFAYAVLAESALSFIGVGPPAPAPSWGNIIAEGRDHTIEAWWIMLFPGLGISLAALGMNLLGDGLRDLLDPRLKVEG
jgi:peptide/nickel transport system permease protein